MPTTPHTNYIKDFIAALLKQREHCVKAEIGNYRIKVIMAFERIKKAYTVVSNGKFKHDVEPYKNLFKNHEADIRLIMFGESARQHKKLKEMFDNAWLIANSINFNQK